MPAILASSALLLTACQSGNSLATFDKGDARLKVDLPSVCEAFLQKVPQPKVTGKTNAIVGYLRTADALDDANGRIGAGADCFSDERQAYAAKEKTK